MAAEATEDMSSRGNAVKVVQSPETALELKQLTWSKVGREPMSAALNKKRDPGCKEKFRAFMRMVPSPSEN